MYENQEKPAAAIGQIRTAVHDKRRTVGSVGHLVKIRYGLPCQGGVIPFKKAALLQDNTFFVQHQHDGKLLMDPLDGIHLVLEIFPGIKLGCQPKNLAIHPFPEKQMGCPEKGIEFFLSASADQDNLAGAVFKGNFL